MAVPSIKMEESADIFGFTERSAVSLNHSEPYFWQIDLMVSDTKVDIIFDLVEIESIFVVDKSNRVD